MLTYVSYFWVNKQNNSGLFSYEKKTLGCIGAVRSDMSLVITIRYKSCRVKMVQNPRMVPDTYFDLSLHIKYLWDLYCLLLSQWHYFLLFSRRCTSFSVFKDLHANLETNWLSAYCTKAVLTRRSSYVCCNWICILIDSKRQYRMRQTFRLNCMNITSRPFCYKRT